MSQGSVLLETLAQAVAEMRRLQQAQWNPSEHVRMEDVLKAESEVDSLLTMYLLPELPPIPPKPEGGAR